MICSNYLKVEKDQEKRQIDDFQAFLVDLLPILSGCPDVEPDSVYDMMQLAGLDAE